MKRLYWFPAIAGLLTILTLALTAAQLTYSLTPGNSLLVSCLNAVAVTQSSPQSANIVCAPNTPTPAPITLGWHAPGAHDGLGIHEHGDAPPAWVLASAHQPFTQSREAHVGYKGTLASDQGGKGVESYLITHILTTSAARLHGDHDYQLWIKTPGSGVVSYWSGVLDFGAVPELATADNGDRPIMLSKDDGSCETWYSHPGALVFDLGWTICGRYQNFAGGVRGGNGTYRGMDWSVYLSRFGQFAGGDPALANYCTVTYGQCRLFFLVGGHQYPSDGVVPVN